jgi:hypothetical protein
MAARKIVKDSLFIVLLWLVAAAFLYLLIIKVKLLFH